MKKDIINMIQRMKENRNETYALIAEEILRREDYNGLKMKELQSACHVSATTIFRFCKELNISGFSELKFWLSQVEMQEQKIKIKENAALSRRTDSHLDKIVLSLVETRDLQTDEGLQKVVELLREAKEINLYASGSTYLVAKDFELKLDRIKVRAKAYQDVNLQYFASKNAEKDTLGIGISYSGKTESVIQSLHITKEQGAKTLLITNGENRSFEKEFDYVLYVGATDMRQRLVTTTARLSLLYLLDLIYYSYVNENLEEVNQILLHNKLFYD
ncbi:MAG: MurR/RpiR family transcriptional regulator [Lachnospiraceae bacterium]|nr:MurR/RpiR family transcriptional regulator [Lachnospiraceae bacterium]